MVMKEILHSREDFISKTCEIPTHVIISGDDYDTMVDNAKNILTPAIKGNLYKVYGMDIIRSGDLSKIEVVRMNALTLEFFVVFQ